MVGANFSGSVIDSNFWVSSGSNGGYLASGSSAIVLYSGSSANGSATLNSVRNARFIGGASNRFRTQIQLSDGVVEKNVRRWGAFTPTEGCFFELSGSALRVVTRRDGTDTAVASTSWNTSTTAPTTTILNLYEIYWTDSKVYFCINNAVNHIVSASSVPWSNENTFPIRMENTNINSGSASTTLQTRVATIYRMGSLLTETIYKNISGSAATTVCKIGAGRLHNITINIPVNGNITVVDGVNASGSPIATLNPANNTTPVTLNYNCPFFTGLTIITAAAPNLTIVYE